MSTLEMPACLALLLVMANLALCLSAERRLFVPIVDQPTVTTLTGAVVPARCSRATAGSVALAPLADTANC